MRIDKHYIIFFSLLLFQIILSSAVNLSNYLVLSVLPLMIMTLPKEFSAPAAMLSAFFAGFIADFFTDGTLGLTICALLPVALLRLYLLEFFDEEKLPDNKDSFLPLLAANLVFMVVFVWVDAAGTRPFIFNFLRTLLSVPINTLIGYVIATMVLKER